MHRMPLRRPVITLQSASPSMNRRKGNNPTCAGSRSANAVRTGGTLGSFVDWKVGYAVRRASLLDQA